MKDMVLGEGHDASSDAKLAAPPPCSAKEATRKAGRHVHKHLLALSSIPGEGPWSSGQGNEASLEYPKP